MPRTRKRRRRLAAKSAGLAMARAIEAAIRAGREAQRAHEALLRLSRERAAESPREGGDANA